MVYRRVLLVFFSSFSVVLNEPLCFSALICFNEPFYIFASIDFVTFGKKNCFSGLMWCSRVLCWSSSWFCPFYFHFSELICFNAPICFNEVFYLSTLVNIFALINLFALMVSGLLGCCVGLLLYFNVVFNKPLCFNDLFCF
jgi:hypothetical protein